MIAIPSTCKMLAFSPGADRAIARYGDEIVRPKGGTSVSGIGCGPANILPAA